MHRVPTRLPHTPLPLASYAFGRRRAPLGWLLASLLVCAFSTPSFASSTLRGPLVPPNSDPVECEYPENQLTGTVVLDPDCYYEQKFKIKEPDTVLDCNGAELRQEDNYQLDIRLNADRALVRNCYFVGGKGISVRVRKRDGDETDDYLRSLSPENVIIENVEVRDSENVGIYLHQHTVGVTVRNSIIESSSSAGLYLAPYGRHHIIENNLISNNGHIKPDGVPRIGWYRREGIAIDGSSEHLITRNDIIGNSLGGILLYKNCWEHKDTNPNSAPRTEHARASEIIGNRFGDQPFGVWVASRQSRDLTQMECGDPTPYDNPIAINTLFHPTYSDYPSAYTRDYILAFNMVSSWPDFAEENKIRDNVFELHSRGGIRVEDDETEITGNLFVGDFDYIFVGAPFRARLDDHPVLDTLIRDNSYYAPQSASFVSQLALIPDEHSGTVLEDNLRACQINTGDFLRHGHYLTTGSTTPPAGDCAESDLRCIDGSLEPALCPDADDESIIDETTEDGTITEEPGETDDNGNVDGPDQEEDSDNDSSTTSDDTDNPDAADGDTTSASNDDATTPDEGQSSPSPERSGCQANNQNGSLLVLLIFLFLSLPRHTRSTP